MFTQKGGTSTLFTCCCDFVSLYSDHLYLSTRIRYATVIGLCFFPFSEASAGGKYLKGTSYRTFSRKPAFGVSDQVRLKPVCSATGTS